MKTNTRNGIILSLIIVDLPCFLIVLYNITDRILSGFSIFSNDPNLSWFGSYQAFGITTASTIVISALVVINLLLAAPEAYNELKPRERKSLINFLQRAFKIHWQSRKNKKDLWSRGIAIFAKLFPKLVCK